MRKKILLLMLLVIVSLNIIGCNKETTKSSDKITETTENKDERIPGVTIIRENTTNGLSNDELLENELSLLKNKIEHNELYKLKIITDTFEGEKKIEQLIFNGKELEYITYTTDTLSAKKNSYSKKKYSKIEISENNNTKIFYLVSANEKEEYFIKEKS